MPHRMKKLNIAICGGGFGGLCLAVALRNRPDINVQIFEKAADFVPMAGAGMSIWPRAVSILKKWGLEKEFLEIVTRPEYNDLAFQMYLSNSPKPGRHFYTWKIPGGLHSFHRADFLDVLASFLPPHAINFNHTLLSYAQDLKDPNAPVTLKFEITQSNGPSQNVSVNCDLLVACDGIWSTTRTQMYKELRSTGEIGSGVNPDPIWTGSAVFRALIPYKKLEGFASKHRALRAPQMYCGKSLRILTYPMARREFINFVAFFSYPSKEGTSYEEAWAWQPPSEISKAFLEKTFEKWEPEVGILISLISEQKGPPGPTRWPIHALKPLPKHVHGKVVLLGDAAHATTPHWGFGAGMSIEDANILSSLLSDPLTTRPTLPTALSIYDTLRVAEGRRVIEGSRLTGFLYELNSPYGDDMGRVAEMIRRHTAWIGEKDPEVDCREAVEMLRERLG